MYINKEPLFQNPKSKFILIKDSKKFHGLKLFKTLLKVYVKEQKRLRVYCFERTVADIFAGLQNCTDNIDVKDFSTDPCGWESSDNSTSNLLSVDVICQQLSNFKGVIFLYSITPLLIQNGMDALYKALHKVLKENLDLQLVALVHTDVHDPMESYIIERLASTVLSTITDKENNLISTIYFSSGKVSKQLVEFKISSDYEFEILRDISVQQNVTPVKQPDPTANLPFNLKLKENEKEARSQLQLPYMKMQTDDETVVQSVLEDDYYDEDDPDDDLDI